MRYILWIIPINVAAGPAAQIRVQVYIRRCVRFRPFSVPGKPNGAKSGAFTVINGKRKTTARRVCLPQRFVFVISIRPFPPSHARTKPFPARTTSLIFQRITLRTSSARSFPHHYRRRTRATIIIIIILIASRGCSKIMHERI